MRKIKI